MATEPTMAPSAAGAMKRRGLVAAALALGAAAWGRLTGPERAYAGHNTNIDYDSQTTMHLDVTNTTAGSTRISSNISGTAAFVALNNYPVGISRPDGMLGRTAYTTSNCAGVAGSCQAASGGIGVLGGTVANDGCGVYGYSGSVVPSHVAPDSTGVFGSTALASGTGVFGFSGTTGTGSGVGVYGLSGTGAGVRGDAPNSYGVVGTSTNGQGVFGDSSAGVGVFGRTANQHGVAGQATGGGNGLFGTAVSGTGVYGTASTGFGVYGTSSTNAGVAGTSADNNAVFGDASAAGNGVFARTVNGNGLVAQATGGGNAAQFFGNVIVNGNFTVMPGFAKSGAVTFADGSVRRLYATEMPESWFEDVGEAQLVNGRARVPIAPDFAQAVNTAGPYYVFPVPHSADIESLAVTVRAADHFEVQANGKGVVEAASPTASSPSGRGGPPPASSA
jgi:hypothetical protein